MLGIHEEGSFVLSAKVCGGDAMGVCAGMDTANSCACLTTCHRQQHNAAQHMQLQAVPGLRATMHLPLTPVCLPAAEPRQEGPGPPQRAQCWPQAAVQ